MKLAVKLAIGLMLATALVFGVYAWQLLRVERRNAEQLVTASAERVGDIIRRSARYQMLRNDREALYRMIRDVGSEPGIRRVRIFSKTGEIRVSTDDAELHRVVDKTAEACYGCHAQAAPIEKLKRADRARVFAAGGERVLGVIMPIENQQDCWSAECHVHPREQKVLGVIDTHLSLAAVDAQMAEHNRLLARFTAAAVALVVVSSILFIWLMVYRPVQDLVKGIRRVAAGDLERAIPVRSQDEIGQVAGEFNHMMEELKSARTEIEEWTRTLGQRVERKSRELEQAHHSLLQSEKLASVGKLAATVAHEINNPLFGILTNARLAKKMVSGSELAAEQKTKLTGRLDTVERESQRCGEIVKNLLMFSRQAPPRMEEVAMDTVVGRAVALVGHSFELQNIDLRVELDDGGVAVRGDAGQLQQVLLALLVNAGDAMPQGGQVVISTERAGQELVMRVRDNGPGVADELRDRIFEPFFSTKEDGQRTGLGLAIALGIVEQHGGHIELVSQVGQGSEFVIHLPVAAAEMAQARGEKQ
ncbi:MAG: HAMP domain-containing histidine kinase [Bryobacterales bacterium]|nr:HAMP domain-containing histidine kinase [Bryobacterales bacterium]